MAISSQPQALLVNNYNTTPAPQSSSSVVDLGKKLLDAAKYGRDEEVRELLRKGAPFTTDWLGTSPLHYAAQNGHVNTSQILMRAGMSMDARTKVDKTPMHLAVQSGQKDAVDILIKTGANINAQDMLKMTPLHWAAEEQNFGIVVLLVENKADIKIKSKFDKTPFDVAMDKCSIVIAKYLQDEEKKLCLNLDSKLKLKPESPSSVPIALTSKPESITSSPSNSLLSNLAALAGVSPSSISSTSGCSTSDALSWLQSEMLNINNSVNNSIPLEAAHSLSLTEGGRLALQAYSKQNESEDIHTSIKEESRDNIGIRCTPVSETSNNLNKQQHQMISLLINGQIINIPANQLFLQPTSTNQQQNSYFTTSSNGTKASGHEIEPFVKRRKIEKSSVVVSDVLMHNTSTDTTPYISSTLVDNDCVEAESHCIGNEDEVLDLERDILQKQLEKARKEAQQFREELKKKEMEAEICRRRLAVLNKSNPK